jgi:hypothetical protein
MVEVNVTGFTTNRQTNYSQIGIWLETNGPSESEPGMLLSLPEDAQRSELAL